MAAKTSKISVKVKKPKKGKKPKQNAPTSTWEKYAQKEEEKARRYAEKVKEAQKKAKDKESAKAKVEKIHKLMNKA